MPSRISVPGLPPWLPAVFDILSDAIVGLDDSGCVRFLNQAAARLAGQGEGDAIGRSLSDVLPLIDETTQEPFPPLREPAAQPPDEPRPEANAAHPAHPAHQAAAGPMPGAGAAPLPAPLATGWRAGPAPVPDPRSTRRRRVRLAGDLEKRILEAVFVPLGEPVDAAAALLVLRDSSAQLRAERALRESGERYRGFIAQSAAGIWRLALPTHLAPDASEEQQIEVLFADGLIAEANQVSARMHGLNDASELLGKRLDDVLPRANPQNLDLLRSFIRSTYRLHGAESHDVDSDGIAKHSSRNFSGIMEEGCLAGVWATEVDITDQKGREEQLRRKAEELLAAERGKDQFLAKMAHALRNPLAPIRNSVALMEHADVTDASFRAWRSMVERQVRRLSRLVDDLLDVSRITHGNIRLRKEVIDLRAVVERAVEAIRPLIETRGHLFTLRLPAHPVRLDGDAARLEQVISNLLNNAAKYTMPEGQIWLTLEQDAQEAALCVRDSGIGLPPDVLSRVFEGESATGPAQGGLGIGLSLVRSLVKMHGGSVEAHSRGLGQGSEFVVRLPVRTDAAALRRAARGERAAGRLRELGNAATASREAEEAPAAGLRVLVVEDDVDGAESLANLLRLWHHQVSVAQDGHAALELARAERPQAVMLDIGLPGLDGYQVARRLRSELGLHETLVVALTGYGQPEDRQRSREAGINYHFVKPVEPLMLRLLLGALPVGAEP